GKHEDRGRDRRDGGEAEQSPQDDLPGRVEQDRGGGARGDAATDVRCCVRPGRVRRSRHERPQLRRDEDELGRDRLARLDAERPRNAPLLDEEDRHRPSSTPLPSPLLPGGFSVTARRRATRSRRSAGSPPDPALPFDTASPSEAVLTRRTLRTSPLLDLPPAGGSSPRFTPAGGPRLLRAREREQVTHPRRGELGVDEQPRLPGEPVDLAEVPDRARALEAV